jgi:hypothetical protein
MNASPYPSAWRSLKNYSCSIDKLVSPSSTPQFIDDSNDISDGGILYPISLFPIYKPLLYDIAHRHTNLIFLLLIKVLLAAHGGPHRPTLVLPPQLAHTRPPPRTPFHLRFILPGIALLPPIRTNPHGHLAEIPEEKQRRGH